MESCPPLIQSEALNLRGEGQRQNEPKKNREETDKKFGGYDKGNYINYIFLIIINKC